MLLQIDKCFGFDTAVEEAQRALISAKVEAASAYHGVGVVKVMGRQSGFIALNASMASGVVDIVSRRAKSEKSHAALRAVKAWQEEGQMLGGLRGGDFFFSSKNWG